MKRTGVIKLSHRLFALCVLTAALVVVGGYMDAPGARAQMFNCEPCNGCTPDSICSGCGLHARPTDNFCSDGLRAFSCAGICKPPGGFCTGDLPFCEGVSSLPVCHGGQWECDTEVYSLNNCSGNALSCPNGAFCYGAEFYCADGNGCTGAAPACSVSGSMCNENSPPECYVSSRPAVCNAGSWRCGL